MKKRILSFFMSLVMLMTIVLPAISVWAAASDDRQVSLSAGSDNNIVVKGDEEIPDYDFSGELSLYAEETKISRDYNQSATVMVTNNSEKTIEYYLVSKNSYDDLFMNFVRSGSIDSPLVIKAGESQEIKLDIFAQNAEHSEYNIPVFAMVVEGENTIEDSKCTLKLSCDEVSLNFSMREISEIESTLTKTLKLTNNGDALTDVSVSLEGEIADYVMLNPVISNYQMNRGASVEIKAAPDLTKMKNNNVSVIKGHLVVSSGGESQKFDLVFDTKGQEITSTTMGQLALKQSGNPYINLTVDSESVKSSCDYNKDAGSIDVSVTYDMTYGELSDKRLTTNLSIVGKPYSGSEATLDELRVKTENGKYYITFETLMDVEDFNNLDSSVSELTENSGITFDTYGLSTGEKIVVEVSIEIIDEVGDVIPTPLSLAMTATEGVDLYGKYVAANCSPLYTEEERNMINGYAAMKSILLVGEVVFTGLSFVPGANVVAFCYNIVSAILGNLIDAEMDKILENPSALNFNYLNYQCTNAGQITSNFYIKDYTQNVKVTDVSLIASKTDVAVGDTIGMTAKVYPADATNKSVKWSSSNPDVASVSGGAVKGLKEGTTVITVETVDGGYTDSVVVTVRVPVDGVLLFPTAIEMYPDSTHYFEETVLPHNATNKSVRWTSSDPGIVTVDSSGLVTAISDGVATISVTTYDGGYVAYSTVTVVKSELFASFDVCPMMIPKGSSECTTINLNYSGDIEVLGVTYESNNKSVATVDGNGVVTAVDFGEATITAEIETTQGKVGCSVAVLVSIPVTGVDVSDFGVSSGMTVGQSKTLLYEVKPLNAGNKTVEWNSDDDSVVTVDGTGKITAVGPGTATITVKTEEGGFTDSITVTVNEPEIEFDTLSVKSGSGNKLGLFVSNRMHGGAGVNRWYGDPTGTDYVDIADTTYTYSLNGVKVGTSHNSGVTDVSIVEIPVEHLKFGSNNTLVCDYDTNPGHYFVNTDTQITITYPFDTPISYIGTPEELQDVRVLPDFAIYSENIFGNNQNVVIGNETEVSFNVYNRGSMGGWFDIIVSDKDGVIYSEENHYLDAFSGETISFTWTAEYASEDISVKLINKTVGIEEKDSENNEATRKFVARERIVPVIDSITPDYAVEGEGIVFATVSSYTDVVDVAFYIDDVLYNGEVKSSTIGDKMRYWINNPDMAEGSHEIKVVVTYTSGKDTVGTVSKTNQIEVLDKDWNKYLFYLDECFSSPYYYIMDIAQNRYYRTYNVSRIGTECTLTIDKAIYDNLAGYNLYIKTDDSFLYKNLADVGYEFNLENSTSVNFVENENLQVEDICLVKFNDISVHYWMYDNTLNLSQGKYTFEVGFWYYEEYRTVQFDIEVATEDITVDLADYVLKYGFEFVDEINGDVDAVLWYKNSYDEVWNSTELLQIMKDNIVTCMLHNYDEVLADNTEEAFICITTDDVVFTYAVDLKSDVSPKTIPVDKQNLQKYTMAVAPDSTDFEICEVLVSDNRFTALLSDEVIYLTPGEYKIELVYKGADVDEFKTSSTDDNGLFDVEKLSSDDSLTLKWSESFGQDAYVYVNDINGTDSFSYNNVSSGDSISIPNREYIVSTKLIRNDSSFMINSYINTLDNNCITIGNEFNGNIVNTFDTYKPGNRITLYFDNFVDKNGNELVEFYSYNSEDNLKGYVILTNIADASDEICIPVSLNSLGSIDITLPETDGEYSVRLEVATESELILPEPPVVPDPLPEEIILDATKICINCCDTYQLTATVLPEEASNAELIWTSSDESIVTVDENGLVKANASTRGTAYITVATADGTASATCEVKVKFTFWQWLIWFFTFGCIRQWLCR